MNSPTRTREWLEKRVSLFERYCLPSVAAQKSHHARWLVMFDAASPAWLRERVEQWQERCPILEPCYFTAEEVAGFSEPSKGRQVRFINSALRRLTPAGTEWLLTTNLDNDDALADDALSRIEEAFEASREKKVISLVDGLQLFEAYGAVIRMRYPHNHFLTLCEPWKPGGTADALTIESVSHREARRIYKVEDIGGTAAWIEVVHTSNVSNDLRITSRIGYRPLLRSVSLRAFGTDSTISAWRQLAGTARISLYFFKVAAWRLRRKLRRR